MQFLALLRFQGITPLIDAIWTISLPPVALLPIQIDCICN